MFVSTQNPLPHPQRSTGSFSGATTLPSSPGCHVVTAPAQSLVTCSSSDGLIPVPSHGPRWPTTSPVQRTWWRTWRGAWPTCSEYVPWMRSGVGGSVSPRFRSPSLTNLVSGLPQLLAMWCNWSSPTTGSHSKQKKTVQFRACCIFASDSWVWLWLL